MRALRHLAVAALGVLVLGACTPQAAAPTPEAADGRSLSRDLSAADRAACTSGGGTVQRRGRASMEMCVRSYADAGKQCTDSSQCEGRCIGSKDDMGKTANISGQCQADNRLFGCVAEVHGGSRVDLLCID
ncbi:MULTISPECIES: hypothetical protein [Novosphingobium]|jgi:hypothetical protein|uniref:Secreted protein n=1 Tax=Novosphingobium panipatense TaxID=428991 RepID=A0ABY1QRN9_9SPHN|nr:MULTISPECIES: hypothetical protein [Novosphingobium]SMP78956.1 hypothetical protein SAMN06296065_11222 [Novosphingobium panipatense]